MDESETNSRSSCDSLKFAHFAGKHGEILVQVKALVMIKDESTGLWRPLKPNHFSLLTVRKDDKKQYFISGHRISDHQEVFECQLLPTTSYHRGDNTSTFHHWRSDNYRHGVTFLNLTDARKFERFVRKAIQEISPPRGSQSEEEIFVKTDTIILDCDTEPVVPSRPHKPKRLTEEYKGTSSDSQRESSSSERDSPTGALSYGYSNDSPTSSNRPTSSSQPKLTLTSSSSAISGSKKAKSANSSGGNSSSPTQTASSTDPALPPRSTQLRTTTPTSVCSSKNSYTDYRNDYFTKKQQSKQSLELDGLDSIKSKDDADNDTKRHTTSSFSRLHISDTSQIKPKNTPPLPRRKKKRRKQVGLCGCFKSQTFSDEYS